MGRSERVSPKTECGAFQAAFLRCNWCTSFQSTPKSSPRAGSCRLRIGWRRSRRRSRVRLRRTQWRYGGGGVVGGSVGRGSDHVILKSILGKLAGSGLSKSGLNPTLM
jgi:hypothetical protein